MKPKPKLPDKKLCRIDARTSILIPQSANPEVEKAKWIKNHVNYAVNANTSMNRRGVEL